MPSNFSWRKTFRSWTVTYFFNKHYTIGLRISRHAEHWAPGNCQRSGLNPFKGVSNSAEILDLRGSILFTLVTMIRNAYRHSCASKNLISLRNEKNILAWIVACITRHLGESLLLQRAEVRLHSSTQCVVETAKRSKQMALVQKRGQEWK